MPGARIASTQTPLTDLLVGLQDDVGALEEFRRDPRGATARARLPPFLARLVLAGDEHAIEHAVFVELAAAPPRDNQTVNRGRRAGGRRTGALSLVGTGIALGQVTPEARALIEQADKVFALVVDPVTYAWLARLNPTVESLASFYAPGKLRASTYREMVAHVMQSVRADRQVTVAFYGHPAVGSIPAHDLMRHAARRKVAARLVPAVSAADCLFAELGIDPAADGLRSLEAMDLVLHRRKLDPTSPLLVWQCGVVGQLAHGGGATAAGLDALVARLSAVYPPRHQAVIFEASKYPGCRSRIERVRIDRLKHAVMSARSTLYIPPPKTTGLQGS